MKRLVVGIGLGVALSMSGCCVARGTKIATPRRPRRVEDLEVGDEVTVVEPATLTTSMSRIAAIRVTPRECGTIVHTGGALSVTTDHPTYDPDARGFFPAGDWLSGARTALLVSDERGTRREVVSRVEVFSRVDDVFDLTVEHEWHTFIADGVVVHNKSPLCPTRLDAGVCECGPAYPCEPADAGPDAGAADGGESDGGTRDGGDGG